MRIQNALIAIAVVAALLAGYVWWAQPSWTPNWLERSPSAAATAGPSVTGPGASNYRSFAGVIELKVINDDRDIQITRASFGTMPGANGFGASNIMAVHDGSHQVRFTIQVGLAIYFAIINTPNIAAMPVNEAQAFPVTWIRQAPQRVIYDPSTITVGNGGAIPTDG